MNPLNHVAIIMDGNGRWGLKNKNSRNAGHKAGLTTVEKIIKETIKQKIKFLTLYAFSTENWKRPKKEIDYLFTLLENFLTKKLDEFHKNKIKLKIIGTKNFSTKLNKLLSEVQISVENNNYILNLLNIKLLKLKSLIENKNGKSNKDLIDQAKPPIFWKEKENYYKLVDLWSIGKINNALIQTHIAEINLRKGSVRNDLVIKNLLINLCRVASNLSLTK